MKISFFKSIKFRLAMTFTVILFVFAGSIILLFNIAINNYLSTRQNPANPPAQTEQTTNPPKEQLVPVKDNKDDLRVKYSNNLESIKTESVYGLIALAFIALGLGYYLAGRFLRPLNELNKQIEKLKSDNLGTQIEKVPENEVGKTISFFNEMSLRLKKAFDQQMRFVQDASHELRTPLTILRTNMETVLDDKNASKDDLKESMSDALQEIDSATDLANDLLALSRPESKIQEKENLIEVVSDVVGSISDMAKKSKVDVSFDHRDEKVIVKINKSEIARAIKNLIENAIKYSNKSKGPKVTVAVIKSGSSAIIEISDNGIGIPKEELGKIFDRFYRVDKSRDRETGGFGLGLAITKKIITDHRGKIVVASDKSETVFTIKLPLL